MADKPSEVSPDVSRFDRFAERAASFVGRAPFFGFCVLMVIVWVPTLFFLPPDTSQLLINTSTTIITFLMVALLENSTKRSDKAIQHKLNAIADGLADVMRHQGIDSDKVNELCQAVGLEHRESSSDE